MRVLLGEVRRKEKGKREELIMRGRRGANKEGRNGMKEKSAVFI